MDFESYNKAGVSLGSGALLICNDETCVVDLAKVLLNFFKKKAAENAIPAGSEMNERIRSLTNISEGTATLHDLEDLEKISQFLYEMSNCGLGQTAATPIRDMFNISELKWKPISGLKVCPAGTCPMSGRKH